MLDDFVSDNSSGNLGAWHAATWAACPKVHCCSFSMDEINTMTNGFNELLDSISNREVHHNPAWICLLSLLIRHVCLTANALLPLSLLHIIIVVFFIYDLTDILTSVLYAGTDI